MIKKILTKKPFAKLILLSSPNVELTDKIRYLLDAFLHFAPVVFILEQIKWWTSENQKFSEFMWLILCLNMIVGIVFHIKNNSFSWKQFLLQNAMMVFVVGVVLVVLETFRYTAGDNIAGDVFRWFAQTLTLFYPASKILKNIFILSNGQYPPEFMMRKLYNFEKNGDLSQFFNTGKVEIYNDEDFRKELKKRAGEKIDDGTEIENKS